MHVSYNSGCLLQQPKVFDRQAVTAKTAGMELKDRIKFARTHAGLTQDELGKLVGASQQAIGKLERGGAVGSKLLPKIGRACGISVEWLDTESGTPFQQKRAATPAPAPNDDIAYIKMAVAALFDFIAVSTPAAGPELAARLQTLGGAGGNPFHLMLLDTLARAQEAQPGQAGRKPQL